MQKFKNLKMAYKLGSSFAIILLLLACIAGISLANFGTINTGIVDLTKIHTALLEVVNDIDVSATEQELVVTQFALHKEDSFLATFEELDGDLDKKFTEVTELLKADQELIDAGWMVPVEKMATEHDVFVKSCRDLITAVKADASPVERDHLADQVMEHSNVLMTHIDGFLEMNTKEMESVSTDCLGSSSKARRMITIIGMVSLLAGIGLAAFLTKAITGPMTTAIAFADKVADGDFRESIHLEQKDEIGLLANALDKMKTSLAQLTKEVQDGVNTLSSSSSELSAISEQMSLSTDATSKQSELLAGSAVEMSNNITSVAASSEEAATNVNLVAVATEEMTTTVKEIAKNTAQARTITLEAVDQSKITSEKMDELGKAANDISKVTEVITEISEQTNLLALNATIEAARAGESGKGFAVVANEIKELAKQTSEATMEINNKIESIQNSTKVTVKEIEQISGIICNVSEIVASIASAVEQQAATSQEISENVSQASYGIQDVNEHIAVNSTLSNELARGIAEVNQSSSEIADSSNHVHTSSKELSQLAETLSNLVAKFKV